LTIVTPATVKPTPQRRWMRGVRPLLLFLLVLGCGAPSRGSLYPGDARASPSMEALPDPDVGRAALTERMRFAWTLAEESFLVPPPPRPAGRSAVVLQAWQEAHLASWLERKTLTIEAARRELDEAAEESHRQRIIGGAIVGLMYEDVARFLRELPSPEELDSDPEILAIHRGVLEAQARPFLEHARRAYSACAQNAIRPPTMRHWSRFCRVRGDALPGGEEARVPASGETMVEVIVD
jgi:hypothetical protein